MSLPHDDERDPEEEEDDSSSSSSGTWSGVESHCDINTEDALYGDWDCD